MVKEVTRFVALGITYDTREEAEFAERRADARDALAKLISSEAVDEVLENPKEVFLVLKKVFESK